MPKRKRSKDFRPAASDVSGTSAMSGTTTRVDSEQERAARLFADSIRVHEAADQAARESEAAAARHRHQHSELVAAKETAAARLRGLRADGRPRTQMAEAEAAYRSALASLTEFETGERPHWAPVEPGTDEPSDHADTGVDDSADGQPS